MILRCNRVASIVNKCNNVLAVMRGKISVLETYRDVRYAYKILERDKNASGTGNLVEREVDGTNTVG